MTTDGTYEGWANRETWALNLWLSNDQGLYELTLEHISDVLGEEQADARKWTDEYRASVAGEAVKDLWEEITDPAGDWAPLSDELQQAVRDVGSLWRVDWDEIGQHWLTAAQEDEQGSSDEIGAAWLESLEDQS